MVLRQGLPQAVQGVRRQFQRPVHRRRDVNFGLPSEADNLPYTCKDPDGPGIKERVVVACGWGRAGQGPTAQQTRPDRINPGLLPKGMPVVGKGVPSQLTFFHQGSLPGALAFVLLLANTDTIIVALPSFLALSDVPYWVA